MDKILISLLFFLIPSASFAQSTGKSSTSNAASTQSGTLNGLTFAAGDWQTKMPTGKDLVFLCYSLKKANSSSLPFTIEPTPTVAVRKNQNPSCANAQPDKPLLQRESVIVVLDATGAGAGISRVRALNINLSATAVPPINSAPIRPSIGTGDTTVVNAAGQDVYYFRWPIRLAGDTQPSLAINLVYVGPAPGDPWTADTVYPAGSVVTPVASNGHYYVSSIEGRSGTTSPTFSTANPAQVTETVAARALTWSDLGTTAPPGVGTTSILSWSPYKAFPQGAVLLNPANGHYYVATVGGLSGGAMPSFPTVTGATVAEPSTGAVTWEDIGTSAPAGSPSTIPQWSPGTIYGAGQVITNADNGHFYLARVGGISGSQLPNFPVTTKVLNHGLIPDGDILWQDAGTTAPTAVASAGPTSVVLAVLPAAPIPPVHSLYYFNLTTGIAVNWNRNSTFAWSTEPGAPANTVQEIKGSLPVEPVLLLTTYLPGLPVDAQSPWHPRDLIPGVSFGFSLSSPANSVYVGASSEIWRDLQLCGGLNLSKINTLAPITQIQTSTNSPTVVQKFGKNGFLSITLNIDFIAGLFGAHI